MDEDNQVQAGNEPRATEGKLRLPPLSPEDQKKFDRPQKKLFADWTGFSDKTLWHWLNLLGTLAIPLVVVAATIAFGLIQAHLADLQYQQSQQQAQDQQHATTLQTYLDNLQDLLLNHHLLESKPSDDVAILARARTLTALQELDPKRKALLLIFLHEAKLIGFLDGTTRKRHGPIIELRGADLNGSCSRRACHRGPT